MEQRQSKNVFVLAGGLNTEINELNFPDGFTTDEANYEILLDGSRRRRKGLAAEDSQGSSRSTLTFSSSGFQQCYLWKNVGGDPTKDVVVYKQQDILYFCDADETMSGAWKTGNGSYISLDNFASSGATTANLDDKAVSFTHGRGRLLVTGQYVRPFYVEYDADSDQYEATAVRLVIRDFSDIEDTITVSEEPTGTITEDHRYNLRNRGWKQVDMNTYFSDKSKHPAKNALWYKGYKRTYGASIYEADGQQSWDSNKLENEAFGNSSAPRGSTFIEPFDSTFGYGIAGAVDDLVDISTWSYVDNGSQWTVTITTGSAHGLSPGDEFTVENNLMRYNYEYYPGEPAIATTSFDGKHTAAAGTTGSTLIFVWTDEPTEFTAWESQFLSKGRVDTSTSLIRSNGTVHDDSTAAVEFFAGRGFYAGMSNTEWADTIFYSQIVDTAEKFARCYQQADPTDEDFNAIVSSDGGHIVIPGLSGVIEMKALRNALIILSTEGVWEITGARGAVFTADGYAVKKLSNVACSSLTGVVVIEDSLLFTGPGGIYIVAPNQYTGLLEVTNAIERTIQTKWNAFTTAEQERCSAFYDDSQKRAYFMLGPDGSGIAVSEMLCFDSKVGAWFRYTFNSPSDNVLLTGIAIPDADDPSTNKKAKFLYQDSVSSVNWADFAQTSFDDWDGNNGPLPYMYTSWDNLGDFQRRRQAPIITCYSQRTETGFTESGGQYTAVNPSSTLMSGYWDWVSDATNEATTNKITATQEIYRKVRDFAPSATTDLDGYPVVVTRNKLRGRGRVLQLKFEGATDKDSHILGFTTNYKISRKV